jgi:hypothetical protein
MDYLERILQRLVDDGKGEGFMARSLRDQIAAQAGGQTAQNLYITGMVKRNLDQKPQGE